MGVDQNHWQLIQRCITGNAGDREKSELKWLMSNSEPVRRAYEEAQKIWNETPPEPFTADARKAWLQFSDRTLSKKKRTVHRPVFLRKKSGLFTTFLKVAAAVLVFALAGVFVYYGETGSLNKRQAQLADVHIPVTLETSQGEKARITFSDGTRVTLNAEGAVRFPEQFSGPTREVYLNGEAYFEVVHQPDRPFIVHTRDAEVVVLGTSFNVRAWDEDAFAEVVVRDGTVSVQSTSSDFSDATELILTGGYKTMVARGALPTAPAKVDPVYHLLWTTGGIYFDNTPFYRVIKGLERRFNVQISVAKESILQVPYTGTFQYADLDEILPVIAVSMQVSYSRKGNEVRFY